MYRVTTYLAQWPVLPLQGRALSSREEAGARTPLLALVVGQLRERWDRLDEEGWGRLDEEECDRLDVEECDRLGGEGLHRLHRALS